MKFLRQFMIILLLSFLGEVLKMFIPLPIPASVYGLVESFTAIITANTSHNCSDHNICYGSHRKNSTNDSTEERNQK